MSKINNNPFVFSHSVNIPAEVAARVWDAWNNLAGWQHWDASLKGIEATENGLSLGKRFLVIPKAGPGAIAVSVTALIEGVHFTTTANSPMGLLSFGHTLTLNDDGQNVSLQHSICALPVEGGPAFPPPLLEKLQADVITSVNELSQFTLKGEEGA
ncbi:SRPBCC family protein [Rosenbergiella collisarenosi]|uniref:hypothetical protein n=1 Tax=Rosenbergiella collisarenosi TaxID=1544695 RepID=UPI001BDAE0E5|nr:hypothetical protein [Rosenbergiella collisarenosi]MBT0720291.1 SRPBCC family protein [Rosenbergiella collisarenosi]